MVEKIDSSEIHAKMTDAERERISVATAFVQRQREGKDLDDWLTFGLALEPVRREAMRKAGCKNGPSGRRYQAWFRQYLHDYELDCPGDAGWAVTISDTLWMRENLADVEAVRATFTPRERREINHPKTMRKHVAEWQKDRNADTKRVQQKKPSLLEEHTALIDRCDALQKKLDDYQRKDGQYVFSLNSTPPIEAGRHLRKVKSMQWCHKLIEGIREQDKAEHDAQDAKPNQVIGYD